MQALAIYAGPNAKQHLASQGLSASDVKVIPAAAGGPKGLILGPLDRFMFNEWLPNSQQAIDLVGADALNGAGMDRVDNGTRRLIAAGLAANVEGRGVVVVAIATAGQRTHPGDIVVATLGARR